MHRKSLNESILRILNTDHNFRNISNHGYLTEAKKGMYTVVSKTENHTMDMLINPTKKELLKFLKTADEFLEFVIFEKDGTTVWWRSEDELPGGIGIPWRDVSRTLGVNFTNTYGNGTLSFTRSHPSIEIADSSDLSWIDIYRLDNELINEYMRSYPVWNLPTDPADDPDPDDEDLWEW